VGGRSNLPPPADAESARSSSNVVHAVAEQAAKAGELVHEAIDRPHRAPAPHGEPAA
jgi:hypothetical protein